MNSRVFCLALFLSAAIALPARATEPPIGAVLYKVGFVDAACNTWEVALIKEADGWLGRAFITVGPDAPPPGGAYTRLNQLAARNANPVLVVRDLGNALYALGLVYGDEPALAFAGTYQARATAGYSATGEKVIGRVMVGNTPKLAATGTAIWTKICTPAPPVVGPPPASGGGSAILRTLTGPWMGAVISVLVDPSSTGSTASLLSCSDSLFQLDRLFGEVDQLMLEAASAACRCRNAGGQAPPVPEMNEHPCETLARLRAEIAAKQQAIARALAAYLHPASHFDSEPCETQRTATFGPYVARLNRAVLQDPARTPVAPDCSATGSAPVCFNDAVYLAANGDVASAINDGMVVAGQPLTPFLRFALFGWSEGRPGAPTLPSDFDAAAYLANHADVAAAIGQTIVIDGVAVILESAEHHYLLFGSCEGRTY
jgi:hypothetical protein